MSQPTPPPSVPLPPPLPADPAERSGCTSPLSLGCGLLLLLLLGGSGLLVSRQDRLFRWGLERTRSSVVAALPQDTTPGERARLDAAFAEVADAVTSGRVNREGIDLLRETLGHALAQVRDGTFTRADVSALSARLEALAGVGEAGAGIGAEATREAA